MEQPMHELTSITSIIHNLINEFWLVMSVGKDDLHSLYSCCMK